MEQSLFNTTTTTNSGKRRGRRAEQTYVPRRFVNVRIVSIMRVDNRDLACLAHDVYRDESGCTSYMGYDGTARNAVSLDDAQRAWFDSRKLSSAAGAEDRDAAGVTDPNDLDTFIRNSGVDHEYTDLIFDKEHEFSFKQAARALRVRAECCVEFDANEQPSYSQYGATDAGNCDVGAFADWDDDSSSSDNECREPVAKRTCSEPRMERVTIVGLWPTLSRAVPLDIMAMPFAKGRTLMSFRNVFGAQREQFDALRENCAILPAHADRISLRSVRDMMAHGPRFHMRHINSVMRELFPSIFCTVAQLLSGTMNARLKSNTVCHGTVRAADGSMCLDRTAPLDNTVSLAELRTAIEHNKSVSLLTLTRPSHTIFSTVLLLLFARELHTLIRCYGPRRWVDAAARGIFFVRQLHSIAARDPHVLCFGRLKYRYCIDLQQCVADARATYGARRRRIAAALRWLAALPELSFPTYSALVRAADGCAHSRVPLAMRPVIGAAVDFYCSVLKNDTNGSMQFDSYEHRQRALATGRGGTSGHMFTVLGDHGGSVSDDYDSAYADGTFCLDDYAVATTAAVAATTTPVSKRAATSGIEIDTDDSDDAPVPLAPARLPRHDSAVDRALVFVDDLHEARVRCHEMYGRDLFVRGIEWLIGEDVVVRRTRVGTGPVNKGSRFDCLYTAEMWSTQTRIVDRVIDIYRRGLRRAVRAPPTIDVQRETASLAQFNELVAFQQAARARLNVITMRERRRRAADEALRKGRVLTAGEHEALADDTGMSQIEALATCVEQFFAERTDTDTNRLIRMPHSQALDATGEFEEEHMNGVDMGISLSDEQCAGVRAALRYAITIFMAPGGCGKTQAAREVVRAFPPDQVIVTAQTAKACQVLQERVGQASTIHSLLYRETLHRQAMKRHIAVRDAYEVRARRTATADGGESTRDAFMRHRLAIERRIGIAEQRSPFEHRRVVVLDEASLVSADLFRRLLDGPSSPIDKLVILGDTDQLGSIGAGAVLRDLCRALPHCVHLFTCNFRSEGRAIFSLARSIVRRTPAATEHDFSLDLNEQRLIASPTALIESSDTREQRASKLAAADDASLVFLRATNQSLPMRLASVLSILGAYSRTPNDATYAVRHNTHIIATTNYVARRCNSICRALYHGEQDPTSGEYVLPPALSHRVLRNDKIYFRTNFRVAYDVTEEALAVAAAQGYDPTAEEDVVEHTSPASASEEGCAVVEQLSARMKQLCGVDGLAEGVRKRRFYVRFFNSEIVTAIDFYNTYKKLTRSVICLCGKCDSQPNTTSPVRNICALLPHLVPEERRELGDISPANSPYYHDQGMSASTGTARSNEFRRMVVFRTQARSFKQVSVEANMPDRACYEYAYATTVHRFQGSGADVIILVLTSDSPFADMTMAYTSVTRAAKRFIVLGDERAFRAIIERRPVVRRSDMWLELANAIADVHVQVAHDEKLPPPHGIADCLGVEEPSVRAALRCDGIGAARRDIGALWQRFDTVRRATLERAQLEEL